MTCSAAAKNGHLEILKYAHENGCPWNEWTCEMAAKYGHLDCLKYAHENGCPWDEEICEVAAACGHLDCLKYAHENGCPWNVHACLAKTKSEECREYLLENITGLKQYNTSMDTKCEGIDDRCAIYLDNKNKVQFKPCNHYVCIGCCNEFIQRDIFTCQICRAPIKKNVLIVE